MTPPRAPATAIALALGCMAALSPKAAHAGDRFGSDFTPRGWQFELMPAAAICVPTVMIKCKSDGEGKTKPFVGGRFTVGYRPLREMSIGLSYVGAGLRPDWSGLPFTRYETFAHMHGAYLVGRPTLGLSRVDLSFELGLGWSYVNFDAETSLNAQVRKTTFYTHGFSMTLGPSVDVFLTQWFFLGAKFDMMLNFHTKLCDKAADECRRREKGDQLPVHVFLPGIHLGFVIG